jgi:hypothetical protein
MKVNIDSSLIALRAGKKNSCNFKNKKNLNFFKKGVTGGSKQPIKHTYCISKIELENGETIEFNNEAKCYEGKRPTDAVRKAYNAAMKEVMKEDSESLNPGAIIYARRATQNKTYAYACTQEFISNPNDHEIRLGITKNLFIKKLRN